MKEYQFDGGSGGAKWRETIKHYLISKAPEIELVLKSVENSRGCPSNHSGSPLMQYRPGG